MFLSWAIYDAIRPLAHFVASFGAAILLTNSIHLVERRGQKEPIDPQRQLEISTLLESIPEPAVIVNTGGRIVDANSLAGQMVGKTRDELCGMGAEQLAGLLETMDGATGDAIYQRALAGQAIRHERRVLRNLATGGIHELLISANPILADGGRPIAALLIARDVTELAQLQRRIGDIERHRAIGEMAAALAHDFNNILDTISQATAVLELSQDRPANERKQPLSMIQNAVRRGAEMVQRIREYLQTGSGAARPVDVCTILQEAVELTRPLWQKANVTVTMRLTPAPDVNANTADLRRVFSNLVINAIEAMPNGGEITIACGSGKGQVVATISDTGVGIPPEHQNKIFYAYFTTKPRGTGLGLSGAQKILLQYGGNISFRSEVGKGTTFTIVLPAANGKTRAA